MYKDQIFENGDGEIVDGWFVRSYGTEYWNIMKADEEENSVLNAIFD